MYETSACVPYAQLLQVIKDIGKLSYAPYLRRLQDRKNIAVNL